MEVQGREGKDVCGIEQVCWGSKHAVFLIDYLKLGIYVM